MQVDAAEAALDLAGHGEDVTDVGQVPQYRTPGGQLLSTASPTACLAT